MSRDPDTEDHNVDAGDENCSSPFEFLCCTSALGEDCYSIENNLQQKLDLKNVTKENEE